MTTKTQKKCGAKGCVSHIGVQSTPKGLRCVAHDPARAEARRAASLAGVRARSMKRAAELIPRAEWPLEGPPVTVEDWRLLGAHASEAMWKGQLPPQIAKEIASLVRASLATFAAGRVAAKIAAYEQRVATIEELGSAKQQARILELERQVEGLQGTRPSTPALREDRVAALARIAASKPPAEG